MDKDFWNNYFKSEKLMCLKYNIETPTSPVVFHKDKCWGFLYAEDIKIKHEINS